MAGHSYTGALLGSEWQCPPPLMAVEGHFLSFGLSYIAATSPFPSPSCDPFFFLPHLSQAFRSTQGRIKRVTVNLLRCQAASIITYVAELEAAECFF